MKHRILHLCVLGTLLCALATAQAQVTPTVTITVTPTSANTPAAATLTWSSTGATSCVASGSWSGTKATSGSQSLTNLVANATYTLACKSADVTGTANLSWTAPTQNTDGTAITNLDGYRIYHGTSSANLDKVVDVTNSAVSAFSISNLAPATWYFGVRAYNTAGAESAMSNIASKTLGASGITTTKSATFTAIPVPNAPSGLTVAEPTAFRLMIGNRDQETRAAIGTVPLNWPCVPQPQTCWATPTPMCLNIVALGARRDLVKLSSGTYVPPQVWAQCKAQG